MRTTTERDGMEAPEGYLWVAEPDTDPNWILEAHGHCRAGGSRYTAACGRPAVAAFRRPHGYTSFAWWRYCEDHLYGHWIEDGQLWHWVLREIGENTP